MKSNLNILKTRNNKENIITQPCEKITCNICNSLILKCNLKRHQETEICKNKALLTTMTDEEKQQQRTNNNMNIIRDIMIQISIKS